MKFKIEIKETLSRIIEVEAETPDQAIEDVQVMYQKQEIVIDHDDYVGTDITQVKEGED